MKMIDVQEHEAQEVKSASAQVPPAMAHGFTRRGLEGLEALKGEMNDLEESLLDIASFGGPEARKKAQKLIGSLHAFTPSITMIGQVKSGKTMLVNAMAARPDMLPADVNPWTSVVTSLHLNQPVGETDPVASFQFFDESEWDFLVEQGGRIGELSARAGASDELQKVRAQIAEMRDKTKARLGRKFELLLGQTHTYGRIDEALIKRYVCIGDDFEEDAGLDPASAEQGQFAEITKSADLYLDAPALPIPLTLRDTPGVNDTFMMREQITINSLRGSRICVVVLSASQALSSMDMGLIRLISNVKSREILIFVNRIDELADPAHDIPEIHASILQTLADNNGPRDVEVLFGSAYWANMALASRLDDLAEDSMKALDLYANALISPDVPLSDDLVWQFSGLPSLFEAISARISEGEGAEIMRAVRKRALNHLQGLKASSTIVTLRQQMKDYKKVDPETLGRRLDQIEHRFITQLNGELNSLFETYAARIDQSHKRFLDRALESLLQHLETHGEQEQWQYSPDGLRLVLRSGYQLMQKRASDACRRVFAEAAKDLTETYCNTLAVEVDGFSITIPEVPMLPPPVTLGQTIALDLQGAWWKGWWQRRRGYRAYADAFYQLIEAETEAMINDLKKTQAEDIRQLLLEELAEFLSEQSGILSDVSHKTQVSFNDLKGLFGVIAQEERDALFEILFEEFAVDEAVTERKDAAA